jgi:hypothetical protein
MSMSLEIRSAKLDQRIRFCTTESGLVYVFTETPKTFSQAFDLYGNVLVALDEPSLRRAARRWVAAQWPAVWVERPITLRLKSIKLGGPIDFTASADGAISVRTPYEAFPLVAKDGSPRRAYTRKELKRVAQTWINEQCALITSK